MEVIENHYSDEEIVFSAIPRPVASAMFDLFVSWPAFELQITSWLIMDYDLDPHEGPILLGNMETKTKLDRLKALYKHHDHQETVKYIAKIAKLHERFSKVRNLLAHYPCIGHLRDDHGVIILQTHRVLGGSSLGQLIATRFRSATSRTLRASPGRGLRRLAAG